MALGLLGRKIGMTQVNDAEGSRLAVTLIEVGPCLVMQKKTMEKDGYAALKLAFGPRKPKRMSKAMKISFEKIKSTPRRYIREYRISSEDLGKYETGQEISLKDLFAPGQLVDITGRTKGRGFTGVVKRWGMKGNRRTHGTHEFFRHGGSIGTRTWPGNVHKNKKMGGHYGDERITTKNVRVAQVLTDKNCIVVVGSVPGANNAIVSVRPVAVPAAA